MAAECSPGRKPGEQDALEIRAREAGDINQSMGSRLSPASRAHMN